jgi:tRNA 2-selenouridine synthase
MTGVDISEFLEFAAARPVVDVRSPGEFAHGHIPGAINIPIFDDDERAAVGTEYVQVGRQEAVLLGLGLVGPKMRALCEEVLALQSKEVLVHCWRGGMRSRSMAWLFETVGVRTTVLEGGYKAFRRAALDCIATPREMRILGGYTGSGKTEILVELKKLGAQVIDLEGLASHRGSAFGDLGLPPQPTTEHFENMLFMELRALDHSRPLWLEDESAAIGRVQLTPALYANMKQSPVVQLIASKKARVERLVADYGGADRELLIASVKKIERRLGSEKCVRAIELCRAGEMGAVAGLLLDYYDRGYGHQLSLRDPASITQIEIPDGETTAQTANKLIQWNIN